MNVRIEFITNITEPVVPLIQLTKSKNGKTGTATFLFIKPQIFTLVSLLPINKLSLIWDDKKIESNDLQIFFFEGKPFLIKSIFIFKNSFEWFNFLHFMRSYSKETGLAFTNISNSSF